MKYPDSAGFKEMTTSREAAERIKGSGRAKSLRERVWAVLNDDGIHLTADEIAFFLHESPFSIRPRLAELRALGMIEPTGKRRSNQATGGTAHVWRKAA